MAGFVVNLLVGVGSAALVLGVIISHFRKKKKGNHSPCSGCMGCSSFQEEGGACSQSCACQESE